jgi:hypothetical protein
MKHTFNAVLIFFDGGSATIDKIYVADEGEHIHGSWLYAQTNRFDTAQRIVVEAYKFPYISSNKGYPFFRDFLGLDWRPMHTVAASGVYNTQGAMFPRDGEGTGDKISIVIQRYKDAGENGGWDAHLIPVNQNGILH